MSYKYKNPAHTFEAEGIHSSDYFRVFEKNLVKVIAKIDRDKITATFLKQQNAYEVLLSKNPIMTLRLQKGKDLQAASFFTRLFEGKVYSEKFYVSLVEEKYRTRGGAVTKVIFSRDVKWINGTSYNFLYKLYDSLVKQQQRLEDLRKKMQRKNEEREKRETIAKLDKILK